MRSLKETLEVKDKMLANQIISSPDKLSAELDELKRQKIEKEQQLEIFHANIRELGEKQKEFPRFEALLDNLLLSLNKIAQEIVMFFVISCSFSFLKKFMWFFVV